MTGLRRTPLARKKQLRRAAELRRGRPMNRSAMVARKVVRQRRARRDTGPSEATKRLLWKRAGGCCERCSVDLTGGAPFSRHHRRPRSMGGSSLPWINDVTNLLLLCGTATMGCHKYVESHPTEAYREGWKVHTSNLSIPARIPVLLHVDRGILCERYYLTPDGGYALEPAA